MHPHLEYRPAQPVDVAECIVIRGRTRENAVSVARLASLGITVDSWSESVRTGELPGFVCCDGASIVGYCFGERATGEVVVLALLPDAENRGIGRQLLTLVMTELMRAGHTRLFLGCSADPASRSYGFYRHLGWRSTGQTDHHGDELLEYHVAAAGKMQCAAQ